MPGFDALRFGVMTFDAERLKSGVTTQERSNEWVRQPFQGFKPSRSRYDGLRRNAWIDALRRLLISETRSDAERQNKRSHAEREERGKLGS